MELNCLYLDNYLSNMETILVQYMEIEIKSLPKQQPNGKGLGRKMLYQIFNRIVKALCTYLLGREDHMLHVLMKIKYEFSKEVLLFMNLFYG